MADFQVFIQLLLLWLISTIVIRSLLTRNHNNNNKNGHKKIYLPSPPSLPIIGHLHLISSIPHQSFHKLSTHYGPIMKINLGSVTCVVVSSPEIAREFLKTHETSFSNRFVSSAVRYLSYGLKGILFSPYGNYWKLMKKLCVCELLGGRILDQFVPLRQQETLRFLRGLKKRGEAGEAVDVGAELLTLTNSVISRMTMTSRPQDSSHHGDEDEDAEEIRKMVRDTAELAGKFNISDFIWVFKNLDLQRMNKRLKEILDRFDSMMDRVIREHEEERKKRKELGDARIMRDLLDILLEIHYDDNNKSTDEIELTKENIKAFILDIFMAGTDTSAITTEWALGELINHPHVMEKARQEIQSIVGDNRLIQESDLANLPYLRAIVKETLRLHPASPILGRESSENCNVLGYEIPAKSVLFVNLWSMGRNPNIWENPLEFRPERFIEESQLDVRGQNFQLMPFGTGRRVCPGTSLALQLIPTNLGAMIQCFDWKVHGGGDGTVNMEEKPAMTLPRAHPLICVPVPRINNPIASNFV